MTDQPSRPRFTVAPVDPEAERAATDRARQAAEESARAAAWTAAHSTPETDPARLRERLERAHTEAAQLSGQIGDLKRELADRDEQLAALRTVARGYCPHCGRGDAGPTAEQWEQMRRERDGINRMYLTAMGDLGIAINRLDHIRDAATWIRRNYPGLTHVNDRLAAALDEPAPGPAATQATDEPKEI
jgi:hypothetical protein